MPTATRTDAHSPTNMDPADYRYLFALDTDDEFPHFTEAEKALIWRRDSYLAKSGGLFHQCDHCGHRPLRYIALLEHTPTGDVIGVGETCVDNRFALRSKAEFDALRKAAALDRAKQAIKTAAAEQVASMRRPIQLLLARDVTIVDADIQAARDHHIVTDIRAKLWQYGSISSKQVAVVERCFDEGWAKPKPVKADVVTTPAPEGRVTVEGEVVSTKWQDNDFGGSLKMLVICTTPAGQYKVWGTVPSSICPAKGDTVRFVATIARSNDDPAFAFASRPAKAEIL